MGSDLIPTKSALSAQFDCDFQYSISSEITAYVFGAKIQGTSESGTIDEYFELYILHTYISARL